MIVDEEVALERLNHPNNLINKLVEHRDLHNRNTQKKMFPPMIQELAVSIGAATSNVAAGKAFGMSGNNVGYLRDNVVEPDKIADRIKNVHEAALDSMVEAIGLIKPKLADIKRASELSKVAADMARVVEKTSPKEKGDTTNIKVVVYNPIMKTEDQYEEATV